MISVCIATYNGEKYIHEQIASILQQIGNDDEIVVSDDGSTDKTLDVVRSFGAQNIHIYINKGDHGYTPNFENALRNAHGDYIFLSDQDDIWMPDKVEACMKYLKVNDFVVSDALIVDGDNKPLFDSFCEQRKSKFGFLNTLIRFSYLGCCFAFRRKVLFKALPFPKNHILCTHDNWLALVSTAFYKSAFIPLPLIRYRRYGGNASSGAKNANKSILFMIHYRLYLLFHLIGRCLVAK